MAEDFVGIEIATTVVLASIVLSGILIGIGRAFSYKKIENFGVEELLQSIVNAAIIGSFGAIIFLISTVATGVTEKSCTKGDVVAQLSCTLREVNVSVFSLFQEIIKSLNILGYYQSLKIDFSTFSIIPFSNLFALSAILSAHALSLQLEMMLLEFNVQILAFIAQNVLLLLFPIGLTFRTFFATRKIGGFLIALSIALIIFYPSFVLIFPNPKQDVMIAAGYASNFTNNTKYATVPIVDLNNNYALAGKLDMMSGRCDNAANSSHCYNLTGNSTNYSAEFSQDLTLLIQTTGNSITKVFLYSAFAPLFSLILTIIFVRELAGILGGEIGLNTFRDL
jgi:hypothetical protein